MSLTREEGEGRGDHSMQTPGINPADNCDVPTAE